MRMLYDKTIRRTVDPLSCKGQLINKIWAKKF